MKKLLVLPGAILVCLLVLTASCQRSDDLTGRVVVKITDEPFPISLIADAGVTITKVEIRAAESEVTEENTEGEDGEEESPFIVLWEGSRELKLLDLRNGVTEELADLEIPAGAYDLVRVHVSDASIVLTDDLGSFSVDVPSGSSSGVKVFIKPGLTVSGGLTSELLLDFSVEKSFVLQGDLDTPAGIKGFNFKPVIRAANNSVAGRIEGMVLENVDDAQVPMGAATVLLWGGELELATTTEDDGSYAFLGVPAGEYQIRAEKEGYKGVTTDVEVVPGNATFKDFVLTADPV